METYDIEGDGEWVNNSISREAQFWSCGMVGKPGAVLKHDHDLQELELCHTLATEAAHLMGPYWRWLRSGRDPNTHPFFVVAQRGAPIPQIIDESLIRTVLGGTLHPEATVHIEPFTTGTEWWGEIEEDILREAGLSDEVTFHDVIQPWPELVNWFPAHRLADASFVRVDDSIEVCMTLGCVYPRFIVGISDQGSLIGIMTHVVS